MSVRRAALVALGAVVAVAVGGCGSDDTRSATVVQQPTTAVAPPGSGDDTIPTTTSPSASTTSTSGSGGTEATTTPTATTGLPVGGRTTPDDTGGTSADSEQGQGGAGDEEATRVPAAFAATGTALSPTTITIPAFLAIDVMVTATDGAQRLTIAAPGGGAMDVAAGRTATKRLSGLKPGDYTITTARGGRATLHVVSGGDPGP
jgi:hypothetical protein